MAGNETLSVRLSYETRRTLDEAAATHDAAGASALARDILERWATDEREAAMTRGIETMISYLRASDGDWDDEPSDFFDENVNR